MFFFLQRWWRVVVYQNGDDKSTHLGGKRNRRKGNLFFPKQLYVAVTEISSRKTLSESNGCWGRTDVSYKPEKPYSCNRTLKYSAMSSLLPVCTHTHTQIHALTANQQNTYTHTHTDDPGYLNRITTPFRNVKGELSTARGKRALADDCRLPPVVELQSPFVWD